MWHSSNLTPQTTFAYFEKSQTQFSFLPKLFCVTWPRECKHAGFLCRSFQRREVAVGSLECLCPFLCFQNVSYSLQGFVLNCQNLFLRSLKTRWKGIGCCFFNFQFWGSSSSSSSGGMWVTVILVGQKKKYLLTSGKWQLKILKNRINFFPAAKQHRVHGQIPHNHSFKC